MKRNLAYLMLGSNIDPEHNLPAAVKLLAGHGRVLAVSTAWESRPLGFSDQPNYINAALLLETSLQAGALRDGPIVEIETTLGRVRTANKYAPRPIDIDLMLFNHDVFDLGRRHIPDPEIYQRSFVALSLAEMAPNYIHPETGETLAAIAARFDPALEGLCARPDVGLMPDERAAL
jgi:2-amino-4-hydroxy-6-hydroxymethyldihydropteridine diphosphokinase